MAETAPPEFSSLCTEAGKRESSLGKYKEQLAMMMANISETAIALKCQDGAGAEEQKEISELRDLCEHFASLEQQFTFRQHAVKMLEDHMYQQIQDRDIDDAKVILDMKFGDEIDAFQRQQAEQPDEASERQKQRHMMNFDEKTLDQSAEMDDDEELQVVGGGDAGAQEASSSSSARLRCPITQAPFTNPVRNRECGHTYEREAIERMIMRERGRRIECPIGGCPQTVQESTLERDVAVEREIQRQEQVRHHSQAMGLSQSNHDEDDVEDLTEMQEEPSQGALASSQASNDFKYTGE